MALHPMAKMAIVAALVTSVLFCEIFACVVSQSGKPALIILPMLMMPVPLLLLRCCGGDDFMSSGPRGRHWAEFWSAFFFTSTLAIPICFYVTGFVPEAGSLVLSLAGVLIAVLSVSAQIVLSARAEGDSYSAW